ncbi:MAG: metallophosphoesterase [Kofleriaceae bacterium]
MSRWVVGALVLSACSTPSCPASDIAAPRDFLSAPAIVDMPSFSRLYAVSDIHGGYDRLIALLLQYKIVPSMPADPGQAAWGAGDAVLIVTGDLIDKGSQSLEVIDLLRTLQIAAATSGGHVIVTAGNHEAEFLADPHNSKADAFDGELSADGLDPCLVATTGPRGVWLRALPIGARIGDWFFSHAGDTHGQTIAELETTLRAGLVANDFRDPSIVGSDSILEARAWWEGAAGLATTSADALGVSHVVFGHTPDALGPRGAIATGESGVLFRIDVGMSPAVDDSAGSLLAITHDAADELATELRADGGIVELWRGPAR